MGRLPGTARLRWVRSRLLTLAGAGQLHHGEVAGQHPPDAEELRSFCVRSRVRYKPADVVVVRELPRTPANKIDRRALRQRWMTPAD